MGKVKIREIFCKSILSPSKLPGCDYVINPYVGCAHGCVWCYARFMRGYTKHENEEWGSFVDVKINAPEVLIKDFRRLHYDDTYHHSGKEPTIFLSSVCDPYQPVEVKYQLTRRCLEILASFDFPIAILTQSALVTCDIDLFKRFKDIEVGLSFITLDKRATLLFQPRAATPTVRVETLKKLHQAGIRTYIHIGPILPYFTDFNQIFQATHKYIDLAMGETLNTRGENWTNLIRVLSQHYSQLLGEIKKWKFQDPHYLAQIRKEFKKAGEKYKIKLTGIYTHGKN